MNPNIAKQGKKFSSTNQPKAKNGVKPSKIRAMIEQNDLGQADVQALGRWLLEKTPSEIKAIAADPKQPMLIHLYAKAVLDDADKSGMYNAELVLNRMIGKSKETVETSGTQTIVHIGKEFDKL